MLLKRYRVEYPFTEDPSILTYNINQAIKIAELMEQKAMKKNLPTEMNAEFNKMIEYGALVELSEDDMRSWNGPAH